MSDETTKLIEDAWIAGFRAGWERGTEDQISAGHGAICPSAELLRDNEWPFSDTHYDAMRRTTGEPSGDTE